MPGLRQLEQVWRGDLPAERVAPDDRLARDARELAVEGPLDPLEPALHALEAEDVCRQLAVRVEAKRLGQETEAGLAERPHLPGDGRRKLPPEPDERPPTRQGSPHLARRQAEDRREPGRDAHGITDAPGLDEE